MNSSTPQKILASAQALIATGGYHGFSYADIASIVGLGKASIHHHFPTKADLVQILVASYRQEAEAGMAAIAHDIPEPAELLQAYVGYWTQCVGDSTKPFCVCALLAGEAPTLPAEVATEVRAYFRSLASWFAEALERGVVEGVFVLKDSAQDEAEALMAMFHGAMLSARAYDDPKIFGVILASALRRLTV
jgi:TetR/AcrR family transcriptional repressor of nem operon